MVGKEDSKKNYINYVLVGLLVVAAFAIGSLYQKVSMLEKGVGTGNQQTAQGAVGPSAPPKQVTVSQNDPSQGDAKAKVTVIEFADFQCPYCGAYSGLDAQTVKAMQSQDSSWQPVEPSLIKDYVNTGKVRFVWKDYPFLGQESIWSGEAARCAQDQGKFWEYHDYLYSHQQGENQGAFSKDNLKKFAVALKLNTADFNKCLDSDKYLKTMQDAQTYGQSVGVSGTPATFVNGQLVSGAVPYSQIKPMIDAALK